jgi:hypothetical protein
MPIETPRPSLTTNLAQRYETQPVGGAFNARNIIESGVDPLFASHKGAIYQTENGFETEVKIGVSQFKNDGEGTSFLEKGINTTPYDASGIPVGGLS